MKRFISRVHNHEPFEEDHAGKLRVIPSERSIPKEVLDYGQSLLRSGMRMRDIHVSLQHIMKDKGESPMWTYKDVCNKLAPSLGEKARDCSDFLNLLRNRHDSKSWNIHCDNEGRLSRAFFTLEEGKEAWIKASTSRVLLYDTSHATNRHGMKLGCFCTTNANGMTVIVACSLLVQETIEDFEWVFKSLQDASNGHAPRVVLTDGDQAMAYALKSTWPNITHLLCLWHFAQNVVKNLKPILGNSWSLFRKSFWEIAMESDGRSIESFDRDFEKLKGLVMKVLEERANKGGKSVGDHNGLILSQAHTPSEKGTLQANDESISSPIVPSKKWTTTQKATRYLDMMYAKRRQWASRWTWQHFTQGAHSTQRSESIHAAIKGFLSSRSSFTHLLNKLSDYAVEKMSENYMRVLHGRLFQASLILHSPLLDSAANFFTPFAWRHLSGQLNQAKYYLVSSEGGMASDQYRVQRICSNSHHNEPNNVRIEESLEDSNHTIETINPLDVELGMSPRLDNRSTTLGKCSCQYNLNMGLPCRHILALYIHKQIFSFKGDEFNDNWKLECTQRTMDAYKDFFSISNSPNVEFCTTREKQLQTKEEVYVTIQQKAKYVCELASCVNDASTTDIVLRELDRLASTIVQKHASLGSPPLVTVHTHGTCQVSNPPSVRGKGRPQQKRRRACTET